MPPCGSFRCLFYPQGGTITAADYDACSESAAALASRWGGDKRTQSKQIRVDADAADLLAQVPDRDRRAVASKGVRKAAAAYLAGSGDD